MMQVRFDYNTNIDVVGAAEMDRAVQRIKDEKGGRVRFSVFDSCFSSLVYESREIDTGITFWDCVLRDVVVRDVVFTEPCGFKKGTVLENVTAVNVKFKDVRFRHAVLRDCYVEGVDFGDDLSNDDFAVISGCEFVDVRMNGRDNRVIGLLEDSVVSGSVKNITFKQNTERSQCRGVDLSRAKVSGCVFEGVDMGQVVCNPAWSHVVVEDWVQYVPGLKDAVVRLRESSVAAERLASYALATDIEGEEAVFGGVIPDDRGAKYVHLVTSFTRDRKKRDVIFDVYESLGVSLRPK